MWYQYVEDSPDCYSFCLLLYRSICYLFGSLNRFTISLTYIGDPDAATQDQPGLSPCSLPYLSTSVT